MGVVFFGHTGVSMPKLLGDDRHWYSTHGKVRGVGMPQNMKGDWRRDVGRFARPFE